MKKTILFSLIFPVLLVLAGLGTAGAARAETLTVWFSCTGNTEAVAQTAAAALNAGLWQIVPEEPYTADDLNYHDDNCRANREQNDPDCRPAIADDLELDGYDTILLAYPIWWGEEPRIIDTWLEQHDLTGKRAAAICTSGGSGIETSYRHLQTLAPDAQWLGARRFAAGASEEEITGWLASIGLEREESRMLVQIGENTLHVRLAENESAASLREMLREGPLTLPCSNYGGFEKTCPLGTALPVDETETTAQPGDVMLYAGDRLVLFYGANQWNYTRIGWLEETDGLAELLGGPETEIVLSLEGA